MSYRKLIMHLMFEPRDIWIGLYWDLKGRDLHLYLCLIPCFPLHLIVRDFCEDDTTVL